MPAPTGATLTTLNQVLKEYYRSPLIEQLNNETLLLQRLDSTTENLYGKYVVIPVHAGRSGGVGARFESDLLPDAGNQVFDRATFNLAYLYGRLRFTGPSMEKSSDNAGSFVQAMKAELDLLRNDLKKDTARQLYGNGDGVISGVVTAGASNVVTPATRAGVASAEALNKGQFYIGMLVDIGTTANMQSIAQGRSITAISATTITISGATVTVTGGTHFIFRAANVGSTVSPETNGLQNLVSTTAGITLGGVNSTTSPYWDNIRDTTVGALSMDRLMQAFNRVRQAGGETSLLITSLGIQRAYFNLFTQTTKYADPLNLEGGYSALNFMNKPLVGDIDCPYGSLFLLDERFIKVFANRDWHFLDSDGDVLKWTQGYDAFEGVLARYLQLAPLRRNVQMVISGVTVGGATDPGF